MAIQFIQVLAGRPIGSIVCTLSDLGTPTFTLASPTFTLASNPGNLFALNGNQVLVNAVLSVGMTSIVVVDSNGNEITIFFEITAVAPFYAPGDLPFSLISPANIPVAAGSIYAPLNWPTANTSNFFTGVKFYFDLPDATETNIVPVTCTNPSSFGWPPATIPVVMTPGFNGINLLLNNGDFDNEAVSIVNSEQTIDYYNLHVVGNAGTASDYGKSNLLNQSGFGSPTGGNFGGALGAGIVAAGNTLMMGSLIKEEFTETGAFDHMISFQMIASLCNNQSPNFYPPAISGDGSSGNGLFCEGQIMAIPPTTSMPSGLSIYGQAIFNAMKTYGAFCMDTGGSCGPDLGRWYKNVGDAVDPPWAAPTSWTNTDLGLLINDMPKLFPLLQKTGYPLDGYLFVAAPFQTCSPQLQLVRYNGGLMTVSRDSDSTLSGVEQTGPPAGLLNQARIAAFCAGTIGRVTTYDDQIGNRNFVSTGSLAPIIYQSGAIKAINGNPAPLFDGSTNYLQGNTAYPGGGIYLNAVVQPTDFAGNYAIFGSSVSGGLEVRLNATTGLLQLMTNTGTVIATSPFPFALGGPVLIEIVYVPGTSYSMAINRTVVAAGSTAVSAVMTGEILIGSGGPTTSDLFKGLIGHWFVSQGVASNAQFTISSYLAKLYAPLAALTVPTFNPARTSANIALSNGNLTATGTSLGFQTATGTLYESSGKFYYEVMVVLAQAVDLVGVINSADSVTGSFVGAGNSVGYANDGRILIGSSVVTTLGTWTTGNNVSCAIDFGNETIWFRVNGGNWNNSGTANPATNTGGISISSLSSGPFTPAVSTDDFNDAFTINFGVTAYAYTAPSGFGNWGAAPGTPSGTQRTTNTGATRTTNTGAIRTTT